jgi:predicted aldo/keto reductase-like oxidoreductase
VEELKKVPTVPCTACRYCTDDCPQKIDIPGVFESYNLYKRYDNQAGAKGHYNWLTGRGGKASTCIECGVCEGHCPQHLRIPELLKEAVKVLE